MYFGLHRIHGGSVRRKVKRATYQLAKTSAVAARFEKAQVCYRGSSSQTRSFTNRSLQRRKTLRMQSVSMYPTAVFFSPRNQRRLSFVCAAAKELYGVTRLRSYGLPGEPNIPATICEAVLAASAQLVSSPLSPSGHASSWTVRWGQTTRSTKSKERHQPSGALKQAT